MLRNKSRVVNGDLGVRVEDVEEQSSASMSSGNGLAHVVADIKPLTQWMICGSSMVMKIS